MKAFDKVPHQRLIQKVKQFEIGEKLTSWIEDFLTERRQRVHVNKEKSSWKKVTSGIPQGSVLGPLLFVMFVNDLPNNIASQVYLFADDTKLFQIIKSDADKKTLQDGLISLQDWSNKWQLNFHLDKCKVLRINEKTNKTE